MTNGVQAIHNIPIHDFIARILDPEVTLLLIAEDRDESQEQALHTLEASSRYGNEMFNFIEDEAEDRHYAASMHAMWKQRH
ncbi:hypothetical protein H0H81_004107, partial [Sphagnurus paluster]